MTEQLFLLEPDITVLRPVVIEGSHRRLFVVMENDYYDTKMIDAYWLVSHFPNVKTEYVTDAYDASKRLRGVLLEGLCESPIEKQLYQQLVRHNLYTGLELQYDKIPEVNTRLDFAYPKKKIAIYCDGHDYHERTKEQAKRDRSQAKLPLNHQTHY